MAEGSGWINLSTRWACVAVFRTLQFLPSDFPFNFQTVFMLPIEKQRLTRKIRQLCADGYQHYDAGDYERALRTFYQAWLALPKPQTDWPEAGWVLTAIGDAYFRLQRYRPGCEALSSALCCPGMEQAPFTYVRLGQCLWELGGEDEARTALHEAYKLAQMDIFQGENAKYRHAISDLLPVE